MNPDEEEAWKTYRREEGPDEPPWRLASTWDTRDRGDAPYREALTTRLGDGGTGTIYASRTVYDTERKKDVYLRDDVRKHITTTPDEWKYGVFGPHVREVALSHTFQSKWVAPILRVVASEPLTTSYPLRAQAGVDLILPLAEGGDLWKWMRNRERFPHTTWIHTLYLMTQLADGLACLHAHGIAHRDMKPGNVLVDMMIATTDEWTVSIPSIQVTDLGGSLYVGNSEPQANPS